MMTKKPKTKKYTSITISGARTNNLKNVDLELPKQKLIVITGLSGSGKSSITMDTLYAEGQRRYVESLSSYARQFLMRMKKPEVDYIKGISPAIAIEQKVTTGNHRSTVGSMTEVYDYLRLLYARIGKTISPISGKEVIKHEVRDVMDFLKGLAANKTKISILAPLELKYKDRSLSKELDLNLQKGYTRVRFNGQIIDIEDVIDDDQFNKEATAYSYTEQGMAVLIDRFALNEDLTEEDWQRLADSVQIGFGESEGHVIIEVAGDQDYNFTNRFELDGMEFPEPNIQLFNYNNPYGACPTCEGFGKVVGVDHEKVIPDPSLSVYEEAIAPWRGELMSLWKQKLVRNATKFDFPIHRPIIDLTKEEKKLLWTGNEYFEGLNAFFKDIESQTYKIQYRVMLARYRGRTTCPDCEGGRLRKEATYIKVGEKSIDELINLPISDLITFFEELTFNESDQQIASRLLTEILSRLGFMMDLGLGYLHLDRISNTLSGGETQRINLTRTLGSNLSNSLYILDEPSVGLHPRDTSRLVKVLYRLRDLGNTVLVVEHEEEIIRSADYIVDMGPGAGSLGGEVVYAGTLDEAMKVPSSLTTKYLAGDLSIPIPKNRRKPNNFITVKGARANNLKKIDVRFPLNAMTVVTGVSGSGKSTLVKNILYPALSNTITKTQKENPGAFDRIEGPISRIHGIEYVNQRPIGKSSRSNPVTYVKAYDYIRQLMANQQLSAIRGYKPKYFSFNVDGGRCDACNGEGEQVVEMQFLADVRLECEECEGRRFKREILDVTYKGMNIDQILNMTIDEGVEFFADQTQIHDRLLPLQQVGLGYAKLGQPSSTLSGGEAQRVKLAYFLGKEGSKDDMLFIFDEPTTGLHFDDIRRLLVAFDMLVERGHTVIIVEHNLDVIKNADWVIDLGPEGGKDGGYLVYEGPPEGLLSVDESYTAQWLRGVMPA